MSQVLVLKIQSLLESENFFQEAMNAIHQSFPSYEIRIWKLDTPLSFRLLAQSGLTLHGKRPRFKVGVICSAQELQLGKLLKGDPHVVSSKKTDLFIQTLNHKKLWGVLNISSENPLGFTSGEVEVFEALSAHLGVALENQERMTQTKNSVLELQKKLGKNQEPEATLAIAPPPPPPPLLKEVEIVGKSEALLSMLSLVDKVALSSSIVLIQGESGTGKELVARRIHLKSPRKNHPFVTVNCGNLQESLLESELFGHEKGSFTGAIVQKIGLCEIAERGTLFLDEIGELSLGIQVKLLRFLQSGEFYRVGGKNSICVDVRVVSATNRDLEKEVQAGKFREDLFYRLNTITLKMPSLRKRREDIPDLVRFFLNQQFEVDSRVLDVFSQYEWPGNIRELENTVERMKVLAEGNTLSEKDIPLGVRVPSLRQISSKKMDLEMTLGEVEKSHILRVLEHYKGNKSKAARNLDITIKTLYNKLHSYGIMAIPTEGTREN